MKRTVSGAILAPALVCLALTVLSGSCTAQGLPEGFVLRDFLGRTWRNECVRFPLNEAQLKHAKAGHALLGPEGNPVLYQVVNEGGRSSLAFLADLDPFETRAYRFADRPSTAKSDLKVEDAGDTLTVSNSQTGIVIFKTLADGSGPIGGVRLNSGRWVGGSRLASEAAVTAYSAQVVARGPVFAEVVCKATFAGGSAWEMRVRLFANEPVVLVDENCAVDGPAAALMVNLNLNFNPDTLLFRYGKGSLCKNALWKIQPGEVYVLEPWLHWWERDRQGNCFGVFPEAGSDLLAMAAREAGVWVDPNLPREKQADIRLFVKQDEQGLHVDFPLKTGKRKWMFIALEKEPCLAQVRDESRAYESNLAYQYLIKHGHFPLDLVKDYVLTWKREPETYPHMLLTRKDVERFQQSVKDKTPYENAIPGYLRDPNPLGQFNMEGPLTAFFATRDPALDQYLAESALQMMQRAVEQFTLQNSVYYGTAPHHLQQIGVAMLLADAALWGEALTADQRERLLAQAAFLGYTIERPDYWSPVRGYAANPNMTTSVYGYKAAITCLIPSHPRAQEWVKDAMEELKSQIEGWSDDNGGWLEAPHYAMVSFDQILSAFVMAHNAGFNDYLYLPKIKTVANWFSKISTPPDSRLQGFRHLPPAGNTYMQEPTGEFGILAFLFRDQDPEFAAQMQWMFKQHKSFPEPGIGGGYPGFAGYRALMRAPDLPDKAPPWKSELFPQTGVVLRTGFPTERETYLHMIQGDNHAHYDDDSGSVIIWGKGRIVADDYGYYVPAVEDHNLVQTPVGRGVMHVQEFVPGANLDYVAGECGGWKRQIVLVKSEDPLAPTYFVIADSFQVPAPATWRMHFVATQVLPGPQGARVEGPEDVDTEVFFATPSGLQFTTEEKTRRANCGIHPDGRIGAIDTTQILLQTSVARDSGFTAVIYPRLKTETVPRFTSLAGGKVIKVEHPEGEDYVFLSREPFAYQEGDLSFEGTVGLVQIRGGKTTLALGAAGNISAGGKSLRSDKPLPVTATNLIANGDFETGVQDVFPAQIPGYSVTAALYQGNPAPGDTQQPGKYCVALTVAGAGRGTHIGIQRPIFVDPTKTYRVGVSYYSEAAFTGTIGGYASSGTQGNLPPNGGSGTWQWSLVPKGPTPGWQRLETTIGPPGSRAQFEWPREALSTGFGFWISAEPGSVIYLDDLVFEQVKP